MYKTSDNYKNLIYMDNTRHLLRIFIDNVEVESKYILDFKPSSILFSGDEFTLGSICARTVDLKLHKNAVPDIYNTIKIITGIKGEEIPFGEFTVDDLREVDDYALEITLIDYMVKFEDNYDGSNLTYPAKIITVLKDICLKFGVELRFYFFFKYEQRNSCI